MASLIPGYEYDICLSNACASAEATRHEVGRQVFISYRQKDNKYDGWVTEFVDNLKKELEATFKENIASIFDQTGRTPFNNRSGDIYLSSNIKMVAATARDSVIILFLT